MQRYRNLDYIESQLETLNKEERGTQFNCFTVTQAQMLTLPAAPAARIEEHEREMKEMQKKILLLHYKYY